MLADLPEGFSRFDYDNMNAISVAPTSLGTARIQERDRSLTLQGHGRFHPR